MFATTTPLMDVSANVSSNLTILRRFSDWHIQRNWLKNFFKFQYKHLSKDFPKQVFFWYFNYFSLFSLYLCWYNLTYSDQFCWNSCLHRIDTEISQWQPGTHVFRRYLYTFADRGYKSFVMCCTIWYHLLNLKREKHPWRSVTFSKVAG